MGWRSWYERYEEAKARLRRNDPKGANELRLWHGSGSAEPAQIITDQVGFDPRFCDGGLWGRAAYFAADASYSNGYAHRLNSTSTERPLRQLFLVHVAVGRAEERERDNSIRRPSRGYDSVTGFTGGSRVYMVYDPDTRACPTHLVTYEDGGR